MSEATTEATPTVQPDAAATAADEQTPEATPDNLGDAGKAAIDRMKAERDTARREARANADAAKRLTELEESQKTEQQKIADRATAAERERDEARADGLRYKVAALHGVNEDNFDLLGTGDEETITARAERVGGFLKLAAENEQLKADIEALRNGRPTAQQPVAQLRPGASPTTAPPLGEAEYPSHWFPKRTQSGSQSGT